MRYKTKQTYYWSANIAYVVGLITADGCLLNDNRHIDFTSKDRQLVELYASLIRPSCFIGAKHSGMGLPYYRVQFSDVALYDFLIEAGLMQRKSKLLGRIGVPDHFFAWLFRWRWFNLCSVG